jgi:hypothetical protein
VRCTRFAELCSSPHKPQQLTAFLMDGSRKSGLHP